MSTVNEPMLTDSDIHRMAEAVRKRCLNELVEAYEQGGMSGLCVEGRWDLALDRIRGLDFETVLRRALQP